MKYKPHRFAKLVPEPTAAELEELTRDIKENGLRFPIILLDGEILDGRSRQKACHKAGVELRTVTFNPKVHGDDPLAFVVSTNFKRRQLQMTPSEKAAYVVENILPIFEQQAAERLEAGRKAGGVAKSAAALPPSGGPAQPSNGEEVKPDKKKPAKTAAQQAAAASGVSARSIQRAKAKKKGEGLSAKEKDEKARSEAFARIEKALGKDHGFFVGTQGKGPQPLRKTPVLVQFSKLDKEKMLKVAGLLLRTTLSLKKAIAFNDRKTLTERTTLRDLFYLAAAKGSELFTKVDGWTVEIYRETK
jgi:ParB-like chromosome segregation protein Spo0J